MTLFKNMLIYDCEIKHAIPDRKTPKVTGITYCEGWRDYAGMGVSVIGAYLLNTSIPTTFPRYHVFLEDNWNQFKTLAEDPQTLCIGFNNRRFDDRLVSTALGITIPAERSWDLLREIWISQDLDPDSFSAAHGGYGLDALSQVNGIGGKTGNGALAPILWQQGKFGQVIDYCLHDVWLTVECVTLAARQALRDPKTGLKMMLNIPFTAKGF